MIKTLGAAALFAASFLGGCDDAATELSPEEYEALTDLDLLTPEELVDPDMPEPEDEDDHVDADPVQSGGPDGFMTRDQMDVPNPSNVLSTISTASTCINDGHCDSGERCEVVSVPGYTSRRCVGPCSSDADCGQGEKCAADDFCEVLVKGDRDFCEGGGCSRGHGDCDRDSDCPGSQRCTQDSGPAWGYESWVDVCDFPAGHPSYCSSAHPCDWGQGDCDPEGHDCKLGLFCKDDRGATFGFASNIDVCLNWWE